jgi:hypothetical protein
MNGYNELNNFDIYNILKKQKINNFNNILMSDEGYKINNNGYYVLNLNNSNQIGSHWTALYKNNNDYYYYDPFGFVADKEILPYLNKDYKYNKNQHQNINSINCGWWVISCIIFMKNNNNNFNKYLSLFNDNIYNNEFQMINILKKYNLI